MAGILGAWHWTWRWTNGVSRSRGERAQPCPSPPRSGKYNTWKEASELCTPEPERAGYKKKTYRRHPILICGQIPQRQGTFLENRGECWLGGLRTHGYSWSPSMGRNRLGYVTHTSLLSQTFLLVVSFPKPGKKAEGAQRARPKACTTCPRGPRGEGRGIDVAYAFLGEFWVL